MEYESEIDAWTEAPASKRDCNISDMEFSSLRVLVPYLERNGSLRALMSTSKAMHEIIATIIAESEAWTTSEKIILAIKHCSAAIFSGLIDKVGWSEVFNAILRDDLFDIMAGLKDLTVIDHRSECAKADRRSGRARVGKQRGPRDHAAKHGANGPSTYADAAVESIRTTCKLCKPVVQALMRHPNVPARDIVRLFGIATLTAQRMVKDWPEDRVNTRDIIRLFGNSLLTDQLLAEDKPRSRVDTRDAFIKLFLCMEEEAVWHNYVCADSEFLNPIRACETLHGRSVRYKLSLPSVYFVTMSSEEWSEALAPENEPGWYIESQFCEDDDYYMEDSSDDESEEAEYRRPFQGKNSEERHIAIAEAAGEPITDDEYYSSN